MSPSTQTSSSGRCGMCGNCDSSPPWAPENLKRATPAARLALEKRMAERQAIFKKEFEHRLEVLRKQGFLQEAHERRNLTNADQKGDSIHQSDTHVPHTRISPPAPKPETNIKEKAIVEQIHAAHQTAEPALEEPKAAVEGVAAQQLDALDAPERVSHLVEGAEEVNARDSEAAENGEGPAPARKSDYDSDADSFHTADEERSVSKAADHVPSVLKSQPRKGSGEDEDVAGDKEKDGDYTAGFHGQGRKAEHVEPELEEVSFEEDGDHLDAEANGRSLEQTMFQQIQLDAVEIPLHREQEADVNGGPVSENESASKLSDESSQSLDIPTLPMQAIEAGQSLTSMPSENLEDAVYARRRPARGHSRQNSLHLDHYPLPADLVPLRTTEIELEKANVPKLSCSDCTAWRTRVEELQAKVEELTTTLALRDRECASLKTKYVVRGREPGKHEAQLMQECESLRITTEFLYKKLERYEQS
eukprot:GFKZ01015322.1.p1 GENE.GFKZ01015322.1~~GFKZ01015322.1.p1  ORF type:complete len:521 (-),score=82.35 GFKZ01015322.1:1642-3069(-)